MSLENIEQYVKELKAVRYYDQVKKENNVLERKTENLEDEVSDLKETLAANRSLTMKLKEELKQKASEAEKLSKNVKDLSSETQSLSETAKIVGGKKLTLPQLRKLIAKIKAEEIHFPYILFHY